MSDSIWRDGVEYIRIRCALREFFTSRSSLDRYMGDGRVRHHKLPNGSRMPRRSDLEQFFGLRVATALKGGRGMSADESRPDGEGGTANEGISDALVEDALHHTTGSDRGCMTERDKQLMSLTVGKFLREVTADWLADPADPVTGQKLDLAGPDSDRSVVTGLLNRSNQQIARTNLFRQPPFETLAWQTTLSKTQVKMVSMALGRALDPTAVMQVTTAVPTPPDDMHAEGAREEIKSVKAGDALNYFLAQYEVFMGNDGVAYAAPRDGEKLRVARPVMEMGGALRVMMRNGRASPTTWAWTGRTSRGWSEV